MATKSTAPKDSDLDGIPDTVDAQPYTFNSGSTNSTSAPKLGEDIAPIYLPWYTDANGKPLPVAGGSAQAIRALAALKINDRAKYGIIKQGMEYNLGRTLKDTEVQKIWSDAVTWTQSPGTKNGNPVDYINLIQPGDYAPGQGQYGTTKQKQTYITEYSASQAASDANKVFKSELGREVTAKEAAEYQRLVNIEAAKQPSVTDATVTTAPGSSVTKATQQTGFDPTMFAQEFARSMPDYAENYAARNFLKLIDQALTDPTRIGTVVQ